MARNPRLDEAVAIFTELGWVDATYADAPTLPLGTDAQRKAALAGLRSGDTGEWTRGRTRGSVTYRNFFGVDSSILWVFAVRVGVDARRAVSLMPWDDAPAGPAFAVVAERGPEFARAFVRHDRGAVPGMGLRLVAHHRLPVPHDQRYLLEWAACVGPWFAGSDSGVLSEGAVRYRFAEHVRLGVAAGLEGAGPFGRVLPAGVARGWLDRVEAAELVLAALDAAGRPGDRKVWLTVWLDDLHVTDEEILARAEVLIPALAAGDAFTIERLAPVLIAGVDDDLLADVATVALAAPTKKALRVVLEALAARRRPSDETVEVLEPQVTGLEVARDRALTRAVQAVVDAWGLAGSPVERAVPVEGLWRPVPPVWQAPRFDHGEETVEALTLAAAELSARRDVQVVDLAVERFLALANAVAYRDPGLARTGLSGVRDTWDAGLAPVADWVKGGRGSGARSSSTSRLDGVLQARESAVFQRLGQVPCLLSEPSTEDLRIMPTDLVARLQAYQDAGAGASEADLLLALTRLDASAADSEVCAALNRLAVPVLLCSGEQMATPAGPAARRYIEDPAVEPHSLEQWATVWKLKQEVLPASLSDFPPRLARHGADGAVFPTWGDTALDVTSSELNRGLGLQMRRVARRSAPLAPSAVLAFFSARCHLHPVAVDDATLAQTEAWERGLLRPGPPGAHYVDLDVAPDRLAATARVLGEAARNGMLAVVWQVLDDLAGAVVSGQRLVAGAAEVVETVAALLPEVVHAVSEGLADPAVLNLPGTRAVATRSGTSKAVTVAREVVAGLPAPTTTPVVAPRQSGPGFEEIWPDGAGTLPAVVDDASLTVAWANPDVPTKMLRFDLTLPDHPGLRFEAIKGWTNDLEMKGQCLAKRCRADSVPETPPGAGYGQSLHHGDEVSLYWDSTADRLKVCQSRDLSRPRAPLSTSLVAVCVGLAAQDGSSGLAGDRLVTRLVRAGLIGWDGVRAAVVDLLGSPAVSPARLVRVLEDNPTTLPVLWPLLTEPVRVAGESEGPPPRWLNRVLDVAAPYADHLREAARRGLIPADAASWPGLEALAARPGKTAAVTKARSLLAGLRGD